MKNLRSLPDHNEKKAYLKSERCGLTNILHEQSFMTTRILQGRISLHCSS